MIRNWQTLLDRWVEAGALDPAAAAAIRAYEAEHEAEQGLRWPVVLAWVFGTVLISAGVLLYVSSHWDKISPGLRFGSVLGMVAVYHLFGTLLAERYPGFGSALHMVGTIATGAGIFLAGQIFHLQEHWPGGIMLWAVAAWLAWLVLGDWLQLALAALLTPAWLASEWMLAFETHRGGTELLADGLLLLSFAYFSAQTADRDSYLRKTLTAFGAIGILAFTPMAAMNSEFYGFSGGPLPMLWTAIGWLAALGIPLGVAYWLRGRDAWMILPAVPWVWILGTVDWMRYDSPNTYLMLFLWLALGSIGLILWGIHEARRERIHLGLLGFFIAWVMSLVWAEWQDATAVYLVATLLAAAFTAWGVRAASKEIINSGFALFVITVLFFYFSTLMDKLGRSASLIGLGVLFFGGGWLLVKIRTNLLTQLDAGKQMEQKEEI